MTYERFIRKAAGMGEAPREPDPDRYEHRHAHCDVLVVGGGPAGLAAALAAGRAGARVILVDERAALGGSLRFENHTIDGAPAAVLGRQCSKRAAGASGRPGSDAAPPPSAISTTTSSG